MLTYKIYASSFRASVWLLAWTAFKATLLVLGDGQLQFVSHLQSASAGATYLLMKHEFVAQQKLRILYQLCEQNSRVITGIDLGLLFVEMRGKGLSLETDLG